MTRHRDIPWSYFLLVYTDGSGGISETRCASADQAHEIAATVRHPHVYGVRRREELRQGQTAYEALPVDREGRVL